MLNTNIRRVGVFIDVQNMYYSARNLFDRKVNFSNIVTDTVGEAHLIRAIAYTISTKTGEGEPFFEALRTSGIEVKSKELLEYDSGNKKGDWDVGITIDIVKTLDMLDVVVLVSGDGDYVDLGEYIKARGRIFHVASFRESSSTALVNTANIYTNFSDNKRKFLISNAKKKVITEILKPVSRKKSLKTKTTKKIVSDKSKKIKPVGTGTATATKTSAKNEVEAKEYRSRRLSF